MEINRYKNQRSIIQETLHGGNENVFAPMGLHIALLKDCMHTIPTLVDWIYAEWCSYDSSLTKEKLLNGFKKRLNDDRIPFSIVALKNNLPIGIISLKFNDDQEFADLSHAHPWLGSFQIIAEERNKGLGKELLQILKGIAFKLGYTTLFLYTSNPANINWYKKRGAAVIETRPFRDGMATIMQISLVAS